jgi:phosphate:Na+ symporter
LVSWFSPPRSPNQDRSKARPWTGCNWAWGCSAAWRFFSAGWISFPRVFKKAAGNTLCDILKKLTVNRFRGAITGAFVTAVLNSSSVTTVLVVGFVTANAMTLSQSVGVIKGSNSGSTMTAQLLAFDLSSYSLILAAIGFFMSFISKTDRPEYFGMMIMGLGLVFYGMGLMSDGMKPLRNYPPFLEVLARMENPLPGIVAGAVFTALVQSSAATVGIAMTSEGLLTLPAGIALALGANIGTCVTALLAALGKPVEAVRAALVHISFNIVGVLIWLPFLTLLADIAIDLSPVAEGLEGTAKLATEVPRQIANANTLFNVINTLLFIGFTVWFARLAERVIPERVPARDVIIEPKYLDASALEAPSIALENVRREIERTGLISLQMMDALHSALAQKDKAKLDEVAHRDDEIDLLDVEIMVYLGRLQQQMLSDSDNATQEALRATMMNLDNIGDVIESDMAPLVRRYLEGGFEASSQETQEMVEGLFTAVRRSIELVVTAVGQTDQRAAQEGLLLKAEIQAFADGLFERHARRLHIDDPRYVHRVRLLATFIEQLRHVYTLAKRIAKTQIPPALAQQET